MDVFELFRRHKARHDADGAPTDYDDVLNDCKSDVRKG